MQPLQRIISNTHSKFLKLLCKSHNNTAAYTIDNFLQPNNTGHSQIYFLMYIFTDNKILIVYMAWVIMSYTVPVSQVVALLIKCFVTWGLLYLPLRTSRSVRRTEIPFTRATSGWSWTSWSMWSNKSDTVSLLKKTNKQT